MHLYTWNISFKTELADNNSVLVTFEPDNPRCFAAHSFITWERNKWKNDQPRLISVISHLFSAANQQHRCKTYFWDWADYCSVAAIWVVGTSQFSQKMTTKARALFTAHLVCPSSGYEWGVSLLIR
jgi:hypothetical protein